MKREACKFLSGSFAALACVHVVYAVAIAAGTVSAPLLVGISWGAANMGSEAAAYIIASGALAYVGWVAKPRRTLGTSNMPPAEGPRAEAVARGQEPRAASL
ncbi:hypothetical protein [Mycobacterium sp. Marseille-P9652]|uniref:hypothetical protein n=1 Tax=Mycobacterium sp. Marseille-P9652 TaxID=2654950 RepID=UPI0012E7B23A|nr:hypothetical protein [Mycobacterium sp. Marseille-P9652]